MCVQVNQSVRQKNSNIAAQLQTVTILNINILPESMHLFHVCILTARSVPRSLARLYLCWHVSIRYDVCLVYTDLV